MSKHDVMADGVHVLCPPVLVILAPLLTLVIERPDESVGIDGGEGGVGMVGKVGGLGTVGMVVPVEEPEELITPKGVCQCEDR